MFRQHKVYCTAHEVLYARERHCIESLLFAAHYTTHLPKEPRVLPLGDHTCRLQPSAEGEFRNVTQGNFCRIYFPERPCLSAACAASRNPASHPLSNVIPILDFTLLRISGWEGFTFTHTFRHQLHLGNVWCPHYSGAYTRT